MTGKRIRTSDIKFYIQNHLAVLGKKKGIDQVANKLAFDREEVIRINEEQKNPFER